MVIFNVKISEAGISAPLCARPVNDASDLLYQL